MNRKGQDRDGTLSIVIKTLRERWYVDTLEPISHNPYYYCCLVCLGNNIGIV